MMQRFNLATTPIRDALKSVEGILLPSLNIVVWIANNVKILSDDPENEKDVEGGKRKIEVVVGDEGQERERLERERLAEEQRYVFSLFIVHQTSGNSSKLPNLGYGTDE